MIDRKITFDSFIRAAMGALIAVIILMILNRLSSVLLPFFIAWLIAYLIFPLVQFFQYRCKMKYRVLAIVCAILAVTIVGIGVFVLIIPPMINEAWRIKDLVIEYFESSPSDGVPALIHSYIQEHLNVEQMKALFSRQDFLNANIYPSYGM